MNLLDVSNFNLYILSTSSNGFHPRKWTKPWVLSEENVNNPILIPYNILKDLGRQDILVIDFLYRSYKKQLDGVILNEEEDLNTQLQVSSFLGALYNSFKNKFLVLVLCPADSIIKWHYYMSQNGLFEVKIITPNTVPEDFDQETGIVILLSFSDIKLAEYLREYDFFSVVVDHFDEVATKLVLRKLQGHFNIGITSRNFYVDPDQKLKWTMLNWANKGCVGKLADFYQIDNENIACFRDNYKEWWFRLTWKFCDSFVKPTLEEKGNLSKTLRDWAKTHSLSDNDYSKSKGKSNNRKRKVIVSPVVKNEPIDNKDNEPNKRHKKVYNKNTRNSKNISYKPASSTNSKAKNEQNFRNLYCDSSDSSDTIIYENDTFIDETVDTLDDDKPPIGGSMKITSLSWEKSKVAMEINEAADFRNNNEAPVGDPMETNKLSQEDLKNVDDIKTVCEKDNDAGDCKDENDSVSSGEELLCSLARISDKKSPKNAKNSRKIDSVNDNSDNFDDSDIFLKSVATSNSDFSTLENRQKAEAFFDKILEKSDGKPELNALTQMELELTETDVLDTEIPSESDSFLKGMFDKTHKVGSNDKSNPKEMKNKGSQNSNGSFSNGAVDIDTLVAEVMEMVGKK